MLGPGELARHGCHAVVGAAQIAPIILRAGGSRAVSPVEEMLCALAEGGGALEPQVRFIAGRNPGDNRQLATAATAKNGGLKADQLKTLPGETWTVHVIEPKPVFDANDINHPLARHAEPIEREGETAPGRVRALHSHTQ